MTGSFSYWLGQCWASGSNVDLRVDLGQSRATGAFRAHVFGYPGWDALKGEVRDRIEVLTSLDGVTFTSRGLLQTSLWKKNIPINYMLQDDEKATAWNFELRCRRPCPRATCFTASRRKRTSVRQRASGARSDRLRAVRPSPGVAIHAGGSSAQPAPDRPHRQPGGRNNVHDPGPVKIAADAADSDGTVAHVDFLINGVPVSDDTAAPWGTTWNSTTPGTYTLMARAYDEAGNVGTSPPVSIIVQTPSTPGEDVVLWAAEAPVVPGWPVTAEAGAAGGARLQNQDLGVPKVAAALASPSQYFDLTFHAIQGRGYRLWIRGKAQGDAYVNDSAFVQFDHSVDQSGTAVYRIGSTDATVYSVEDCNACGLAGWGWSDNGYGMNGALIYFDSTGPQRVRVQVREDGLAIDQIVLSSKRWLTQAPGTTKNDTIVLAKTDSQQTTNQPPTVNVSSPAANATFTSGGSVTVNANAADTDGTVARVEFLVDGVVVANDTAAPWTTTWTAGPAGSYVLGARAYDDAGAATTSAPVSITVTAPANQPPTVSVSSPAANATFTSGATVTISANAADADGTVAHVEFLVNGAVVTNDTAAPWTTTWTAGAVGNYTLTARAYDDAAAATTSSSVSITVTAPANQPPTVGVSSPAANATFTTAPPLRSTPMQPTRMGRSHGSSSW